MRDKASERFPKFLQAYQEGRFPLLGDWPPPVVKEAFAAAGLDPDSAEDCRLMLWLFSLAHFGRKKTGAPQLDDETLQADYHEACRQMHIAGCPPTTRLVKQVVGDKTIPVEIPIMAEIAAFLQKHSQKLFGGRYSRVSAGALCKRLAIVQGGYIDLYEDGDGELHFKFRRDK
jgi:hypothetical protein